MAKLNKIFVFSDHLADYAELSAGAGQLAETASGLVIGTKEEAERAADYGLKIYWIDQSSTDIPVENYTLVVAALIKQEQPDLILMRSSRRDKLMAGRLGVMLKAGVVSDAIQFDVIDDRILTIRHLVYGGAAVRTEKPVTRMKIALVGPGVFTASAEESGISPGPGIISLNDVPIESHIVRLNTHPKKQAAASLNKAKYVVSIGRGLEKQEDLKLIEQFAATLGAEIACSRPVAEGEKWLPKERYVGVSGAIIAPDIYFALGISGQVQHMVGVSRSRIIVAVNKDKNAPIFREADYGLVGDLYKVVPELIKLVQQ